MAFNFDFDSPAFWDPAELDKEIHRVFDICQNCRRCYNLCPSFNTLLDGIDEHDGDVNQLPPATIRTVVDQCFQCKLCDPHCPYVPPHHWEVDFPRLMLRSRAARVRVDGVTRQDRMLGEPERLGAMASHVPGLANWANRNRVFRTVMEKAVGVHRDFNLPDYASEPFARWFARHAAARGGMTEGSNGKVAFFYTCSVNYNVPDVGIATVQVLEHNNIAVICPEQVCCGMPNLDGGDVAAARHKAEQNVRSLAAAVDAGYDIVVPGPTCSYTLKREYPYLVKRDAARTVAEHTFDVCEYLIRLKQQNRLNLQFVRGAGKIAYHLPCHLRVQNIGFKSRDLLKLLPDTTVEMVEKCSGVDGTWGMKREYYEMSLKVARGLFRGLEQAEAAMTVSDCPLAALQIAGHEKRPPLHPVQVVRSAYGLEPAQ
ncbi:MAG: anaerobic glycerol-3-phosphate dehydrogenase subunit C [Candidatus Binatia bacterium]